MSQEIPIRSSVVVTAHSDEQWRHYWRTMGQPWRWEPEISEDRQAFLAEHRNITPDVSRGTYPFRGTKLSRADVEWLLATHDDGHWLKEGITARNLGTKLKIRAGLDLRGADLRSVDLRRLPLTQLRGGLSSEAWRSSTEEQREAAAIHLEGANLSRADLVEAELRSAHLEGADLSHARLDGASLRGAHLGQPDRKSRPTDLRYCYLDRASTLDNLVEQGRQPGLFSVADIRWGDVNVSVVDWQLVTMLGDEFEARLPNDFSGKRKTAPQRLTEFQSAVRANRQLAALLRSQGLNESAERFTYRGLVLQRQVLLRQRKLAHAAGSWVLDLLAGHGYRPGRTLLWYLVTILGFAFAYWKATAGWIPFGLPNPTTFAPLTWYEALILSVSSFHGRGFFQPLQSLGDPIAALAAIEAVIGLLIEVTFIATFTQRFFGSR